jgi:hypothetical protein
VLSRGGDSEDYDLEIFDLLNRNIPVFVFVYVATIVCFTTSLDAVLMVLQLYNIIEQFRIDQIIRLDEARYPTMFSAMMKADYEKDIGLTCRRQALSGLVSDYLDYRR